MTTYDFIRGSYGTAQPKTRYCASVMVDEAGDVFSYGRHYPLLFRTSGIDWRNTAGYSSTTGKHICYAGGLQDHDVKLRGSDMSANNIRVSLLKEKDHILDQINGTGGYTRPLRQGTKKIQALYDRVDEIQAALRDLFKGPADQEKDAPDPMDSLKMTGSIMALGMIFSDDQAQYNDWALRMLKAGIPDGALHMPDDWDDLSEDEKSTRLNKIIKLFREDQ